MPWGLPFKYSCSDTPASLPPHTQVLKQLFGSSGSDAVGLPLRGCCASAAVWWLLSKTLVMREEEDGSVDQQGGAVERGSQGDGGDGRADDASPRPRRSALMRNAAVARSGSPSNSRRFAPPDPRVLHGLLRQGLLPACTTVRL